MIDPYSANTIDSLAIYHSITTSASVCKPDLHIIYVKSYNIRYHKLVYRYFKKPGMPQKIDKFFRNYMANFCIFSITVIFGLQGTLEYKAHYH